MSRASRLASLGIVLLASGCAGMGMGWEDVLGSLAGLGGEMRGEVDRIDTRGREIQLRTAMGQSTRVRYDSRTEVIYGQRRYSVGALERGDRVSMSLQRDRRGNPYADRIYLEERGRADSRGGRDGDLGRVGSRQRFEGRADRIDTRNGRFELADSRHGDILVTLPYESPRDTRDQFRRLRRGDYVRIEARVVSGRVVQLTRFMR